LGLSLSHDIIKAHGGEIQVATKEGEGTVFIIQLPVACCLLSESLIPGIKRLHG
jgi:signal transduction histidine kinase